MKNLLLICSIATILYGDCVLAASQNYEEEEDKKPLIESDNDEDNQKENFNDENAEIESDNDEDNQKENFNDENAEIESDNDENVLKENFNDENEETELKERIKKVEEDLKERIKKAEQTEKDLKGQNKETEKTLTDEELKAQVKKTKEVLKAKEIQTLRENGFIITRSSVEDLEKNLENSTLKIDLFDRTNMSSAIYQAFSFAQDQNASNNFISGTHSLPKHIKHNDKLTSEITSLVNKLKPDVLDSQKTNENDLQFQILESLQNIYKLLKNDKNIGSKDAFSKFVKGMINVCQVRIARRVANEIMSKYREEAEQKITSTRKSSSMGFGTVTNTGVANFGSSASLHRDEGADDSSFYAIHIGGGSRISIGLDVLGIGGELGISGDVTKSAVFFSLEQLLDSGQFKTGFLSAKSVKQTLKSRQKMQARERELLSIFGKDVEGYLKMIGKIPVSVYLEWPKLTKTSPADQAINVSAAVDASAAVFNSLGMTVVATDDIKKWKRPLGYMTLISDDCSPSGGLIYETIVKFLGNQYDRSKIFLDLATNKTKDSELDNETDKHLPLDKSKNFPDRATNKTKNDELDNGTGKHIPLALILPIILGDIRSYNSALSDSTETKASKIKHEIEERWAPKHKFTSEGRLGVLKSMIATASVLRSCAISEEEIKLFKQLHIEMSRLAQMLEFSKNKSNRSATFVTETTAHNRAIQASASIEIPRLGAAQISINRSFIKDNPLQDENGDCMDVDIVLPVTPIGIVGADTIRRTLNQYRRLLRQNHATSDFGNTLELTESGFNLLQDDLGIPEVTSLDAGLSIHGNSVISVSMCRSDASDYILPKNIRRLPGQEKILKKDQNEWMVWYVKGIVFLNSNAELADFNYSSSVGREKIIIGTDTFGYLTSKFDAFSLGLKDSKDAMSPWKAFKKSQKKQLVKLLKNIANNTSNIAYELQGMYNTIMDNIEEKNPTLQNKCNDLFHDFLSACQDLKLKDENSDSKDENSDSFDKASKLLDQVLQMNFEYNFMINYNNVYAITTHIKNKSQKI